MKTIVLIALLAAATGCKKSEKAADTSAECAAAIGKAVDGATASIKSRNNGNLRPEMVAVFDRMRTTYTALCTEDKWSPEALACYSAATGQQEMAKCQTTLNTEQRTKLAAKRSEVMAGLRGAMPPGMANHPTMLQGSGAAAPAAAPEGSAAAPAGSPAAPEGSAAGSAAAGGGW